MNTDLASIACMHLQTSSIIGNRDPTLEHRPIPVIGDGDVLFMTQLSNDIARSVGGISAVRHHGLRTRKRKSQHNGIEIHLAKDFRNSRNAREDKTGTYGSSSKRLHVFFPPLSLLSYRLPLCYSFAVCPH